MKLMHVVGARPNFMKLMPLWSALNTETNHDQIVVHTGQHYDDQMSQVFFEQLGLNSPDVNLGIGSGTHAEQTAKALEALEIQIADNRPAMTFVYGDVNSTLSAALVCSKLNIPFCHVEAGLRSFDRGMPEEINRIVVDHLADALFTPSGDASKNLAGEGIAKQKICLVGNIMVDCLFLMLPKAREKWATLSSEYEIDKKAYGIVTLHRPSNVDESKHFGKIIAELNAISSNIPLIFPAHPRSRNALRRVSNQISSGIQLVDPVGYVEMLCLQENSLFVITDSGGMQEETTVLGVPCFTLRKNTERPITLTKGTNTLVGDNIQGLSNLVNQSRKRKQNKERKIKFWDGNTSLRIISYLQKNAFI